MRGDGELTCPLLELLLAKGAVFFVDRLALVAPRTAVVIEAALGQTAICRILLAAGASRDAEGALIFGLKDCAESSPTAPEWGKPHLDFP